MTLDISNPSPLWNNMDPVESTVFIPFQPDHRSHVSHLKEEDLVCGPLWRKEGRRREGGRVGRRETQFTCNLCSVSVPAPVPSCPLSSEPRASSKIALPCPWLSLPWTRDHCLLVMRNEDGGARFSRYYNLLRRSANRL